MDSRGITARTTTSSLPAPPLLSPMSFNPYGSPYALPTASDSPPDHQRIARWARSDLAYGLSMPADYGRTNQLPGGGRPSQPIPMPKSRQRRLSFNGGSGGSPLVGSVSNAFTSPLMNRYQDDSDDEGGFPTGSSESLPFPMDDPQFQPSFSSSPTGSVYSSSPYSLPAPNPKSSRRNSTGHPSMFAPPGSSYAPGGLSDMSMLSKNLPKVDMMSSLPSVTSSSAHSGMSSLFSRRGSTSSDASSVDGFGGVGASGLDKGSPYGRPAPPMFPQTSNSPSLNAPMFQAPSRKRSPLPPLNLRSPPSPFDTGATLPPLMQRPSSSRSPYTFGSPAFPTGPPPLRPDALKAAIQGQTKRRASFTIGNPDEDGYSSSSSSSVTPRPSSARFFG